jgi:hypothetical protein
VQPEGPALLSAREDHTKQKRKIEGVGTQKRKIEGVGTCNIQADGLVIDGGRGICPHRRHRSKPKGGDKTEGIARREAFISPVRAVEKLCLSKMTLQMHDGEHSRPSQRPPKAQTGTEHG